MNQTQTPVIHRQVPRYYIAAAVILVALLTSGCFQNYGRLKHNDDVTRAFQTYQVEPDYKYYYYGRTNMPYAIVGIDRAYHMRSRVWREVDHDTEQFKEMIFWVWDDIYVPFRLSGAHITDPSGKKVGIWYSGIWYAAVRFEEDGRIVIMPDTPFLGGPTR
ncbi:MAG: hypothetical protein PVJ41_09715 [Desulfobacterales bacterium]|jgi:hypothetical protein